jgi:hypothetical protein
VGSRALGGADDVRVVRAQVGVEPEETLDRPPKVAGSNGLPIRVANCRAAQPEGEGLEVVGRDGDPVGEVGHEQQRLWAAGAGV